MTLFDRRPLGSPRVVARKTPHRFRPRTAEPLGRLGTGSASPLGEGEERRAPWALSFVRGCWGADRDRKTPCARIVSGAGSGPRLQERPMRSPRGGCAEAPHPNPLPAGEGVDGDSLISRLASKSSWRSPKVVARKPLTSTRSRGERGKEQTCLHGPGADSSW